MPKIVRYLLHSFDKPIEKDYFETSIPEGSKVRKLSVYPDGIHAWCEIPNISTGKFEQLRYKIVKTGEDIPLDYVFADTIEIPTEKGLMVMILYQNKTYATL